MPGCHLSPYPQICALHYNVSRPEVILRAETIQYSGATELLQYFFKDISFCEQFIPGQNVIKVRVEHSRSKFFYGILRFHQSKHSISKDLDQ